ncbi:hypothetical protein CPLU01_16059 [Colletotrichum plurivorum]|uniref:Uncharacterized protein n=1 Tax=Colletotrichum plurivorum TaxID=2175906 RepID=A0A8H6MQF1_9PEZI|nr:hypothetical protein CPLU01_16059 [Colletotrichum plurivorum]
MRIEERDQVTDMVTLEISLTYFMWTGSLVPGYLGLDLALDLFVAESDNGEPRPSSQWHLANVWYVANGLHDAHRGGCSDYVDDVPDEARGVASVGRRGRK